VAHHLQQRQRSPTNLDFVKPISCRGVIKCCPIAVVYALATPHTSTTTAYMYSSESKNTSMRVPLKTATRKAELAAQLGPFYCLQCDTLRFAYLRPRAIL
jgi:hypothetical protein